MPRAAAAVRTIRTTHTILPASWGKRLPCSQAPIVVGDTRAALLLALSGAMNAAFAAGLTARLAGAGPAQAVLTAAGAAGAVMANFFAAVSAYR